MFFHITSELTLENFYVPAGKENILCSTEKSFLGGHIKLGAGM